MCVYTRLCRENPYLKQVWHQQLSVEGLRHLYTNYNILKVFLVIYLFIFMVKYFK